MLWRGLRTGALALCVGLLVSCGGGGDGGQPVDPDTQPTIDLSQSIRSSASDLSYPVYVYLPPGYASGSTVYPVIYAMDAEFWFNSLASTLRAAGKPVILIAIGNGDGQSMGRRKQDYSMPGAEAHTRFLIDQVLPAMEARYRINPAQRTLLGHSMGGLFTALVMLLEDPAQRRFAHYVSQDGSFWFQEDVVAGLEQALAARTTALPASLFLHSATGTQGNARWVEPFRDLLVQRNYGGLVLRYEAFDGSHSGMGQPSFRRVIETLYPAP